jgi:glycosyltransferase involved in cell wall biosynthesis
MLVVTDLERGGTPLRLARLARALRDAGCEPVVGSLAAAGPVTRALQSESIPTFACDAAGRHDVRVILRLVAHVRRLHPDVIHASLTHANVVARLAGLWTHTPVLTSTATIETERLWHRWSERITAGWDAGHIVNSAALARHVVRAFGVPPRRIHVVPPLPAQYGRVPRGSAREAWGIEEADFVVLWAGRLVRAKRVDLLIRAAGRLARDASASRGRLRILIVGEGPLRGVLEALARNGPAGEMIRFVHWQEDLGPLLGAADLFVCCSSAEGVPNAVLEAMCAGVAVLAHDIPTLRELAGDPRRIQLANLSNPRRLAGEIIRLRDAPESRAHLGASAAAWCAATLDAGECARRLIELYRGVTRRRTEERFT